MLSDNVTCYGATPQQGSPLASAIAGAVGSRALDTGEVL